VQEDDVGGFHVAMHQALVMQVSKRGELDGEPALTQRSAPWCNMVRHGATQQTPEGSMNHQRLHQITTRCIKLQRGATSEWRERPHVQQRNAR
jgi:hypothetical protein